MLNREWKDQFLRSLALSPNVTAAAAAAGVSRQAAYQARDDDPEFSANWRDALDRSTDALVGEMYRRAVEGVRKPVYQGGVLVGHVQEYSDTLAIFLAKCHRRDIYGDRLATDVTSKGDKIQTIIYLPENGRGDALEADHDPTPAGPTD